MENPGRSTVEGVRAHRDTPKFPKGVDHTALQMTNKRPKTIPKCNNYPARSGAQIRTGPSARPGASWILGYFRIQPEISMHFMDTYRYYSCLQILLSADTQLSAVSADRVLSADTQALTVLPVTRRHTETLAPFLLHFTLSCITKLGSPEAQGVRHSI